jgi:hypothetical protein
MAGTVGMVEATAITGMAMVFLGMVIITAIAIISSLITAAGNGAPTARSMSATPAIDLRRRKEARPGREARASFFRCHDDHRDRLPGDGNQSRCKLIGLPPDRRVRTNNASRSYRVPKSTIWSPRCAKCIRDGWGDLLALRYARLGPAVRS